MTPRDGSPSSAARWRPSVDGPGRYDHLLLPEGVERVTLGEGTTPLLRVGGAYLKCEHMNPTGSYKDRIAAVGISLGVAAGATGWIGTSSGNAGAAFAAYGARAGLSGQLYTIEAAAPEKLAQVRAYGAQISEVVGFGQDPDVEAAVFAEIERLARERGLVLAITARSYNAAAMDGVKAIAFEIAEELGDVPPAVFVPTGGGGLLASVWEGFAHWRRLGHATAAPRMVCVQPAGCAPIHAAIRDGAERVSPVDECHTAISGLQLTNPPDGDAALAAVRASDGWSVTVEDEEAFAAQRTLAVEHGIFVEPAAAAAYAAWLADPVPNAVVLLTGSGLKTLNGTDTGVRPARVRVDEIGGGRTS